MYRIIKTDYGLYIEIKGIFEDESVKEYIKEKEAIMDTIQGKFSIFMDIRKLVPPSPQDRKLLIKSQEKINDVLERMAVILDSPVLKAVSKEATSESGILGVIRFIETAKYDNWKEVGMNWAVHGIEPMRLKLVAGSENK